MLVKRMLPGRKNTHAVSLRDFYDKRNTVLIIRNARGLGDILTHRMIFEDFKKLMPGMRLVFACPKAYHPAASNHPFVDEVVDSSTIDRANYVISYDTSTCCIKWECNHAPHADKNRADLWAEHCGVKLTSHNMHVPFISLELLQFGILQVKQARNMSRQKYPGPAILLSPIAYDSLRTLTNEQIIGTVAWLREQGCFVYSAHHVDVEILDKLNVPVFSGYNIPEWFSFIHAADAVISVDTATFHYAGGIKKPLTGIFTHADGKYRGQYYDFVLVQKHRDNGNWPCGPCYNWAMCTHAKCSLPIKEEPKPCLTEITIGDITRGIDKMFEKWNI